MGRRGPKPTHPHTLEVAFNEEDWTLICQVAHVTKASKSAVVRAFVTRGIDPLRGRPMPERFRASFEAAGGAAASEETFA